MFAHVKKNNNKGLVIFSCFSCQIPPYVVERGRDSCKTQARWCWPTPPRTEQHSAASSEMFFKFSLTNSIHPETLHTHHKRLFVCFFMTFILFCSGPHSSGAAVGGGERSS